MGWDFVSLSAIHAGILDGLILCKSCACNPSYCKFVCVTMLSHPENIVCTTDIPLQLALSSFCLSFHDDISALAGRGVVQMSHFEVSMPLSLILRPPHEVVGLYMNYQPLQKGSFSDGMQRHTNLWV